MTRKEEIWNAINNLQIGTYGENNQLDSDEYDGSDMQDAFYLGARWADENPKSPWISVNDDLPCNHEELITTDGYYGKETANVITIDNYGVIEDNYMVLYNDGKWGWKYGAVPCYWMPIPELPKQNSLVKI